MPCGATTTQLYFAVLALSALASRGGALRREMEDMGTERRSPIGRAAVRLNPTLGCLVSVPSHGSMLALTEDMGLETREFKAKCRVPKECCALDACLFELSIFGDPRTESLHVAEKCRSLETLDGIRVLAFDTVLPNLGPGLYDLQVRAVCEGLLQAQDTSSVVVMYPEVLPAECVPRLVIPDNPYSIKTLPLQYAGGMLHQDRELHRNSLPSTIRLVLEGCEGSASRYSARYYLRNQSLPIHKQLDYASPIAISEDARQPVNISISFRRRDAIFLQNLVQVYVELISTDEMERGVSAGILTLRNQVAEEEDAGSEDDPVQQVLHQQNRAAYHECGGAELSCHASTCVRSCYFGRYSTVREDPSKLTIVITQRSSSFSLLWTKDGHRPQQSTHQRHPEVASPSECIPRISLPAGQSMHWLPSLHYLSAMSNQLMTEYQVNVSIEIQGCASDGKYQAFYLQASTNVSSEKNTPIGMSQDARDPVLLTFPGLGSYDRMVELVSTDGLDRVVSAGMINLQLVRTEKRKRFCYLVQASEPVDVGHLKTSDSEVIQLVWRGGEEERLSEEDIVFYPNSSWTAGRNRLFREMQIRFPDTEFLYAVFLDDDAKLVEVTDYGMNTGNAWRTFERYLVEWEPAVGLPSYQYAPKISGEAQTVFNFDQIVVAYHWETWPVLLPYTEVFDQESWHYSGVVQGVLCAAFFNSYRIQFNAIEAVNPRIKQAHHFAFHIPMGWIASGLTDLATIARLPFFNPFQTENLEIPLRRNKKNAVGEWFINPTIDFESLRITDNSSLWLYHACKYDQAHPYFAARHLLQGYGTKKSRNHDDSGQPQPLVALVSRLAGLITNLQSAVDTIIYDMNVTEVFAGLVNPSQTSEQTHAKMNSSPLHFATQAHSTSGKMNTHRMGHSRKGMNQSGCAFDAPRNRSTLLLNELSAEDRWLSVRCWVEEHRWEHDACRVALRVDGVSGPWQPLPWALAQMGVELGGGIRTVFPMRWQIYDDEHDDVAGYHIFTVNMECGGSESASATAVSVLHHPEVASPSECIPRISLPAGQSVHWLPSLHYLSAMSNQLMTEYQVNVSIEIQGCASDGKYQAFYLQASTNVSSEKNTPIGMSQDARDPVLLTFPGLGSYDRMVELVSTDGLDRVVSAGMINLQLVRTEKRKRFCYLVQASEPVDVGHLKTSDSEVIQLVWRGGEEERLSEEDIVFYPNSSWTAGRNRLFREMQIRFPDTEFLYAVFLDDDAKLVEVTDYGMNTGNAWRTFERYLVEWEPAVGLPGDQEPLAYFSPRSRQEAQTVFNFDQIVVAYHWETWPVLLPYTEIFDDQSWRYCGAVQNVLCAAFFNSYRIQFNAIAALNTAYRDAEGGHKGEFAFQVPMGWIASGLTDLATISALPFCNPSQKVGWGMPQTRSKEQGPATWFINPSIVFEHVQLTCNVSDITHYWTGKYDPSHPYFATRSLLQPYGVQNKIVYTGAFRAQPMTRFFAELELKSERLRKVLNLAICHAKRANITAEFRPTIEKLQHKNSNNPIIQTYEDRDQPSRQEHDGEGPLGCTFVNASRNRSTLLLNELSAEDRWLSVRCWVEEHRWEQDACRVALRVDGVSGPWQPLPWALAQMGVELGGGIRTVFPMRWQIYDDEHDDVAGYHIFTVNMECGGSESASATAVSVLHHPEVASPSECIPRISLPAGQSMHWLPSLHYLSAMSNQLMTEYQVNVSIEILGCASDGKYQAFYLQASTNVSSEKNTPIGMSQDARDPVLLTFPGLGSYDRMVELVSTDGLDRVVSAGMINLQLVRTEKRKRFCYLVQASEPVDVGHLKTSDSEVIQLVWRGGEEERLSEEDIVFYPNSSWTAGRNRLFREMQIRFPDTEFLYAVFLDDDAKLVEVTDYGMNTGNAWRTFERYLVEWEPAVGLPRYSWELYGTSPKISGEAQTVFNFDQIVVAYHWETWPVLLPYTEIFDDQSWWYCATVQQVLCAAFFNSYRIQFNAIKVDNPGHRGVGGVYKRDRFFHIPMGWIASGLTDLTTISNLPFHNPVITDGWGIPQKRSKEERISAWFMNPTINFEQLELNSQVSRFSLPYDPEHPYFCPRRLLQPYGRDCRSQNRIRDTPYPLMRFVSDIRRKISRMSHILAQNFNVATELPDVHGVQIEGEESEVRDTGEGAC